MGGLLHESEGVEQLDEATVTDEVDFSLILKGADTDDES